MICDSVLKHINKVNIQAFHGLRNVIELEDRRFHYFYNENSAHTIVSDDRLQGLGLDLKLSNKVLTTYKWFYEHFQQLTSKNKVYLLVQNK